MTDVQPAPKQLAMLAAAMRGWDYEEIRAAIIAVSHAGWGRRTDLPGSVPAAAARRCVPGRPAERRAER